jgi:hypothetical protein
MSERRTVSAEFKAKAVLETRLMRQLVDKRPVWRYSSHVGPEEHTVEPYRFHTVNGHATDLR